MVDDERECINGNPGTIIFFHEDNSLDTDFKAFVVGSSSCPGSSSYSISK